MKKSNAEIRNPKKQDVIENLFFDLQVKRKGKALEDPLNNKGLAFAPTNIALCKYWGKRDTELNLPVTSSLSIALPDVGAMTTLSLRDNHDHIVLNDRVIESNSEFMQRTIAYLDLFRPKKNWYLDINIKMTVPVAAGLASSACGFASLISALNDLFGWQLTLRELSILARLGSGSAARSLWLGFVEWRAGVAKDGNDSYGEPIDSDWPSLCLGIIPISTNEKPISSREAMKRTVNSSTLYGSWPKKTALDLALLRQAIQIRNFSLLAGTAESNALSMHATMLGSWPPICYFLPETIAAMHKVWALREEGLAIYFTQDAGPNLKLLFEEKNAENVTQEFSGVEVVRVF